MEQETFPKFAGDKGGVRTENKLFPSGAAMKVKFPITCFITSMVADQKGFLYHFERKTLFECVLVQTPGIEKFKTKVWVPLNHVFFSC